MMLDATLSRRHARRKQYMPPLCSRLYRYFGLFRYMRRRALPPILSLRAHSALAGIRKAEQKMMRRRVTGALRWLVAVSPGAQI